MWSCSCRYSETTAVETVHWTVSKSRLSNPMSSPTQKRQNEEDGFDCRCSHREQRKVLMRSSPHQATVHWTVAFRWVRIRFLQHKKSNTERCWIFCGGGGRIRTIEAKRSRFTVCPLWPLGNSPIFNFCFLIGAGRRTRTPDLLITNQLLYRLSYTGGSNRTHLL